MHSTADTHKKLKVWYLLIEYAVIVVLLLPAPVVQGTEIYIAEERGSRDVDVFRFVCNPRRFV